MRKLKDTQLKSVEREKLRIGASTLIMCKDEELKKYFISEKREPF